MKFKILLVLPLLLIACNIFAGRIEGRVINVVTNQPIVKATVNIKKSSAYGITDQDGYFYIDDAPNGNIILTIIAADIKNNQFPIVVKEGNNPLGDLKVMILDDQIKAIDESTIFAFAESDLEEGDYSQGYVSLLGSGNDVFLKNTSFRFSAARYKNRGLDAQYESGYINGIKFNDVERGRFNYSMFAGLNDATRNKDAVNGMDVPFYGFGDISGASNINTRASQYQQGGKVTLAASNRTYTGRISATYSTGIMNNGWALTTSIVGRMGLPDDVAGGAFSGYVRGMHYSSGGAFFSAEKIFNEFHSLSITAFGGYTNRGQASAATQEAYNLTGSNYYNPNWGMDQGRVRNSRTVSSADPTLIMSHIWNINHKSKLTTGIAVKYGLYASTALNWTTSDDPRPDYYRNLPSFQFNKSGNASYDPFLNKNVPTAADTANYNKISDKWRSGDLSNNQVNFDDLRRINNNANIAGNTARYMIEERHNDQIMARLNSVYENRLTKYLKVYAGVDVGTTKGMHFKVANDLLGANVWKDVDPFSERDIPGKIIKQNDINHPDRLIKEGDIFGYNYNIYVTDANLWVNADFSYKYIDFNIAAKGAFTQFVREGMMKNGRAYIYDPKFGVPKDSVTSLGYGKSHDFGNYAFKGGITYKINGRHFLTLNAGYETRAPYAYTAYISPRIKDTSIDNLQNEQIFSADLTYTFRTTYVRGRVSVFNTMFWDQARAIGFYYDDWSTFVNHTSTGVNKRHTGAEVGLEFKLSDMFTLNAAFVYGDYVYTSNPMGTTNAENGIRNDKNEIVKIGGFEYTLNGPAGTSKTMKVDAFKVAGTPQMAGTLGLSFFHPKMWFADIAINYFDNAYLDFAPLRRTESAIQGTIDHAQMAVSQGKKTLDEASDMTQAIFQQEKLSSSKFYENMTVDISLGKSIRFNNGMMLNINASVSNILNNTQLKTGGFEQARYDQISYNKDKFPPKYYYAYGANFFINVGWRF